MHFLIATLHTVGIKAGDVVTSRRERLRDEDGASTIEVVFWVVALLVLAGLVYAAISAYVTNKVGQIR